MKGELTTQKAKVALGDAFVAAYKQLNKEQKLAVDTLEGPVMVVAGPGTGKTQVLSLRIANILRQTDVGASAILCLTFTRSGVIAMRNRLETYIGARAREIKVATFHAFAIELVEKNFTLLGFSHIPQLLDDNQAVLLVDQLLHTGEWEYIRPRTNPTQYFGDLKQLVSLMKRERLTPEIFAQEIETEIKNLEMDPDSISSRGPTKGQIKKEVEKKIESLQRTREVVQFYESYESLKQEQGFMDYDDVLEYAVRLVEDFDDVRADVYENYQYVLVDEHQDSSLIQNNFLKAVWKEIELPNIFVVGDDRQLIYGFSGASLDYFTEFKHAFGKAQLITLRENYRSTAPVLELADVLLKSSITDEPLRSNRAGDESITLSEYRFARDEIIGAGLYFKKQLDSGVPAKELALLLPKNYQVRNAVTILRDMGLPVQSGTTVPLYALPEAKSFLRVLELVATPDSAVLIAESLLDPVSGVETMDAYRFLRETKKTDTITLDDLVGYQKESGMFQSTHSVVKWGTILMNLVNARSEGTLPQLVAVIGNTILIDQSKDHATLLKCIEIVRSFIHVAESWQGKYSDGTLSEFISYLKRMREYGGTLELAAFAREEGIAVMTLHKSKGLEYEHVWIAHMNEQVLMSEKRNAFTLPQAILDRMKERDVLTAKRELYVALTRAKQFATISHALISESGGEMELAHIVADLADMSNAFTRKTAEENESVIMQHDPKLYALVPQPAAEPTDLLLDVTDYVKDTFTDTKVSVTLLNNFFECPWKWYFRNFLKLPEIKGPSLALGSAVHGTIEMILKSPKIPPAAELEEAVIRSLIKEGVRDSHDLKRLTKDGVAAVQVWIAGYYKDLAKDRVTERSLSYRDVRFSNLVMFGKIDLTERFPDGTITVTDFKTGKGKTVSQIEKLDDEGRLSSYMRQLAMYSYLIEGAEDNSVNESRLLFLEEDQGSKNALYRTRITSEQVDLLVRDIEDYQQLLQSGEWVRRPCVTPTYGSHSECEYCKRAEILFQKNR